MKTVQRILAISLLVALVFSLGCVKRDNPVTPETPPAGLIAWFTHDYDGLDNAIWNQFQSRWIAVYTPPGYDFQINGPRYPTLYLLPGYDGEPSFNFRHGNETYFLASSIAKVADRLIASGEIKPLFIVMPDASTHYGGSFFANSTLAGKWEDMMGPELVHKIDTLTNTPQRPGSGFRTLAAKESRAIAGHSSGGYGAFRIAMVHDSLFNSVSAIDAPLAFDGSGTFGGIKELFDNYLSESGITTEQQFWMTDTTGFRTQPFKLLLYSMASTYSPAGNTGTSSRKFGYLQIGLPFDYQGNTVDSIWNKWLDNDLYSWLNNSGYQEILRNQHIRLETSDHDANLFNQQTLVFGQKLTSLGIDFESGTFTKYPEADAKARTFIYDRLEYLLKFHDKYLRDRNGNY